MAASKSPHIRLKHIRDEIVCIRKAMSGRHMEELEDDYLRFRGTERALLIISEAAKSLPDSLTDRYPSIDWRSIRGIGNILRHVYESIERPILWQVVHEELPKLADIVEMMLIELGCGDQPASDT